MNAQQLNGARVAVVGAGLAGASAARGLARRGASVTVFDAQYAAAGASGAAVGALHPFTGMRLTLREFHIEGFAFTRALLAELAGPPDAPGQRIWRQTPILRLVLKDRQAERWQTRVEELRSYGVRWLERPEVAKVEARIQPGVRGGAWIEDACFVDVAAFVRLLLTHPNIALNEGVGITSLNETSASVQLAAGTAQHAFDAVVVATGAHAPAPLPMHDLELAPYRGTLALYRGVQAPRVALNHRGYICAWNDGNVLVGTVDRHPPFSEIDEEEVLSELHQRLEDVLDLSGERPERVLHWSGVRPALRSRTPLAERAKGLARTWVLTGFGGKGLLVGPLLGDRIAAEIAATLA